MYNCNTDSLGLILRVEVFFSEGHCSGALCHTLFPFLSQRRHSDVENVLFNISSLSKFYLNYEPSLKGPDVDKEQIFYFLRWKVQRKVCFIKPIETIVTRPKGPRDTYN